jgi:putative transposase
MVMRLARAIQEALWLTRGGDAAVRTLIKELSALNLEELKREQGEEGMIKTLGELWMRVQLGEFRMHAALLQLGIELSPRTCGRILALNRSLYQLPGPRSEPHGPKPMPFQASRRHQYWTVDVRYLDMHQLGGGNIYCISILEHYSRCILASMLSRSQDLTAYLMVFYAAIRRYGTPEALVSDGGGIFKAKQAMTIYQALGIGKEQIAKRQAWQSYIESNFNVQRRMADWHFARARSWEELLAVHDRWLEDFNTQVHWAHREREDGRHTPAEVLGWVTGMQYTQAELHRIFYTTRFVRRLDKLGYVRFRHWRLYGEHGVARQRAAVWLYGDLLTLEFGDVPLSQYLVTYAPNHMQLRTVTPLRQFETPHQSPQLSLWELQPHEWQLALSLPVYATRRKPDPSVMQGRLVV